MSEFDIDSAMKLMETAPSTPGTAGWETDVSSDDSALPAEPSAAELEREDDQITAPATEPTSAEEPAAASTETTDTPLAPGETNDGSADQGALPIIEPPSSWKAEEKDVFKSLPRAAQEAIQRREQDRTNELRNLQNSTAAERQANAAEAARLKGLTGQIDTLVNKQVADLAGEFPEIKSEQDVIALATNDPARYSVFQAKLMALNATQQAKASALQEVQQRDAQAHSATMAQAKTALIEMFPAWKDNAVAQKEITEIQDYAISQGVPEAAARGVIDAHTYKIAHKAMLYDRAQAARTAAVDRTPPRTPVKPGSTGADKGERTAEARQTQLRKLSQTGSIEDALGLLRG